MILQLWTGVGLLSGGLLYLTVWTYAVEHKSCSGFLELFFLISTQWQQ